MSTFSFGFGDDNAGGAGSAAPAAVEATPVTNSNLAGAADQVALVARCSEIMVGFIIFLLFFSFLFFFPPPPPSERYHEGGGLRVPVCSCGCYKLSVPMRCRERTSIQGAAVKHGGSRR